MGVDWFWASDWGWIAGGAGRERGSGTAVGGPEGLEGMALMGLGGLVMAEASTGGGEEEEVIGFLYGFSHDGEAEGIKRRRKLAREGD